MAILTILADNREQKGWSFDGYPVQVENVTLRTGDYTIPEACDYDDRLDTYEPFFAVERKSGSDFLNSITKDRERFRDEIVRAEAWEQPLRVNVEAPWSDFRDRYSEVLKYRKIHPNQIEGTVNAWKKALNVEFVFHSTRQEAEQDTFDTLMTWYRMQQYSP